MTPGVLVKLRVSNTKAHWETRNPVGKYNSVLFLITERTTEKKKKIALATPSIGVWKSFLQDKNSAVYVINEVLKIQSETEQKS